MFSRTVILELKRSTYKLAVVRYRSKGTLLLGVLAKDSFFRQRPAAASERRGLQLDLWLAACRLDGVACGAGITANQFEGDPELERKLAPGLRSVGVEISELKFVVLPRESTR
jgi:hypothetical protein